MPFGFIRISKNSGLEYAAIVVLAQKMKHWLLYIQWSV